MDLVPLSPLSKVTSQIFIQIVTVLMGYCLLKSVIPVLVYDGLLLSLLQPLYWPVAEYLDENLVAKFFWYLHSWTVC